MTDWLSAKLIISLPWMSCVTTRRFCPLCQSPSSFSVFPISPLEPFSALLFFSATWTLIFFRWSHRYLYRENSIFRDLHALLLRELCMPARTFETNVFQSIILPQFPRYFSVVNALLRLAWLRCEYAQPSSHSIFPLCSERKPIGRGYSGPDARQIKTENGRHGERRETFSGTYIYVMCATWTIFVVKIDSRYL